MQLLKAVICLHDELQVIRAGFSERTRRGKGEEKTLGRNKG